MTQPSIRTLLPAAIAAAVLLCACIISLHTGAAERADLQAEVFVLSRIPRTLAALLAGAGLAVGGLAMQMIVHNRFVAPNTTGTGEGAAIGLLIAQLIFPTAPLIIRMGFAAFCAMLAMLTFIRIAKNLPVRNPLLLPLVGLIFAGVLEAIMSFIAIQTDLLQWLGVWLNGDFSAILKGRYEFLWGCGIVITLLYALADRLTIIGMGEQSALSLGLNYRQIITLGIILISVITAFITVTIGTIAFLGLIVPNIVRRFTGDNLRRALPWTAWTGAALMLACDILARIVNAPYEIPVSLMFGILGSGIFLIILLKPAKKA